MNIPEKIQTAESTHMSRPAERQFEERKWSRAYPGPRCFPLGPTWAMGDYSPSKQVKVVERKIERKIELLQVQDIGSTIGR